MIKSGSRIWAEYVVDTGEASKLNKICVAKFQRKHPLWRTMQACKAIVEVKLKQDARMPMDSTI
jgi:hypothetical protein